MPMAAALAPTTLDAIPPAGEGDPMSTTLQAAPLTQRRPAVDRAAVRDMLPIVVGIAPFGLLIGLTIGSHPAGPAAGLASAVLFFGGTAHFSALTMISAGAGPPAVLAGVLVTNSRLLLYGAALQPRFAAQPRWFRRLGPALLIDQTFALATALPADTSALRFRRYWLTAGLTMAAGWLGSHVVGLLAGPLVPSWLPLEIAAPAVLVGLLVPHLRRRPGLVAALTAGLVTAATSALPAGVGTLAGALSGLLAGTAAARSGRGAW
jgi:predicted branched-subunit amino acid permease